MQEVAIATRRRLLRGLIKQDINAKLAKREVPDPTYAQAENCNTLNQNGVTHSLCVP